MGSGSRTASRVDDWVRGLDDPLDRRRGRLLLSFTGVIAATGLAMTAVNLHAGKGPAALAIGIAAALVAALVPALVRRGRLSAAGHVILTIGALVWLRVAQEKGGLVSTVLGWQSATLVLGTLIVGARQTVPWLVVAIAHLGYWAARFDPATGWSGAQGTTAAFAGSTAIAWSCTVGFAYLFEREVERATALVKKKNEEMRHVLDEIAQGLSIVGLDGSIGAARSAQLERWLGRPHEDETFAAWLSRVDPRAGQFFELGLETLREGVLPTEAALALLPRELERGDQVLTFGYSAVERRERVIGVLVVVTDVTELRAAARAEETQRAVLALVGRLQVDRDATASSVDETRRLVASLTRADAELPALRRALHTLKGNAGLMGLDGLQARCHALETWSAENDGALPLERRLQLRDAWREIDAQLTPLLDPRERARVVIEPHELTALLDAVERGAPSAMIGRQLHALRGAPLDPWLTRLARQAEALAARLGKPHVDVTLDVTPARVDAERVGPLLASLVHAVRNALDHGIEPEDERRAAGKRPRAEVRLRARVNGGRLELGVEDDGRGISWANVEARAKARGLPAATSADLVEALFADGLSTAHEVTEISGRGVGLSALRAEARALGGDVSVEARAGAGTRLRVEVPLEAPPARTSLAA
jgi:HPt (histidine-containing phosphotransfer) domain-containing protein/two-component sensor histidine kinase